MQIKITKSGLKKDEVFFLTEFGEGRGVWCGAPVNPGAEMDVELELSGCL